MKALKSTKLLIITAITGLLLSFASVSQGQTVGEPQNVSLTASIDAGPIAAPTPVAAEEPAEIAPEEPASVEPTVEPESAAASEPENPAKTDTVGTAKDIYDALEAGKWLMAFGSILMFLVWGIRAFLRSFKPTWAQGEIAGNAIAFGTSFALAVGTALAAGQGLSIGLLAAAAGAAWGAKGLWSHAQAAKEAKK